MSSADSAVEKFKGGYNCAQSVLYSLREYTGLSEDESLKLATGFGSGMGRTQKTCGAVSGGILALNILFGRASDEPGEIQERLYRMIQSLIMEFEKDHGTTACLDLLDEADLLTPAGQERFKNENLITRCHSYAASAAGITENIIREELNNQSS